MRAVDTIVLHYSATYEDQDIGFKEIDAMHKARGWSGCGYHEIVRLDGTIEHGRPWDKIGAGVLGQNTGKLHICCIGGLRRASGPDKGFDTRTDGQKRSTLYLIEEMQRRHGKCRVVGHNELASTQCPGFIGSAWYAEQRSILPPPDAPTTERPMLKQGSRGTQVLALKQMLKRANFHPLAITSDWFGAYTKEQVIELQKKAGVDADGIVGPITWAELIKLQGD